MIAVVFAIALILPVSVFGLSMMPDWPLVDLATTSSVVLGTYNWLGTARADEPDAEKCEVLDESRDLLEAMIVLHRYYAVVVDQSASLGNLNSYIYKECRQLPGNGTLGNEVVIDLPSLPSVGGGGAGGGVVHVTTNDLTLAFLSVNDAQRTAFLEQASPESAYALQTWISENYDTASLIAETIGEEWNMETDLSPLYETPPAFENSGDLFTWFEPAEAFPTLERTPVEPDYMPQSTFDLSQIIRDAQNYVFDLYPQLRGPTSGP